MDETAAGNPLSPTEHLAAGACAVRLRNCSCSIGMNVHGWIMLGSGTTLWSKRRVGHFRKGTLRQ